MEYFNFVLNIKEAGDGRFELSAQSDTMGHATAVMSFALDSPQLAAAQERLAHGPIDRDFLTIFGGTLNDALFTGEVRDLYHGSLGRVLQDDEKGMRLRLCIDPPALSALPWELAYDRTRDTFLATSSETPLTRYINLHEPIDDLRTVPPVSVLVAIPDGSGLDVATERAIIEDALSELGDAVSVAVLEGSVTRSAISQALVAGQHHVFHFIGHGQFSNDDGYLVLNAEDGTSEDLIAARSFAGFFRDYTSMKLVVLNACQGAAVASTRPLAGIAPQLVRAGIPSVVAMQYPFADNAAVLFAREFYRKLCTGSNRGRVDAAVAHARNRLQMDFADTLAFATPVLYMRSPTGVIFDLATSQRARQLLARRADIDRLKAVKTAHQSNIALLVAADGGDDAKTAIRKEGEHIAAIDGALRKYYFGVGGLVVASWVVLFASWIGLFNVVKLDDWLERKFVAYMDGFVTTKFDRRVSLILASDDPAKNGALGAPSSAWRCHHARLLSGLSAARASVVAFDMYFEDPSDCDAQFADAIRQASGSGTGVIAGVREAQVIVGGIPAPVIAPLVREALGDQWGILEGVPVARRVGLAAPITLNARSSLEGEAGVFPSLALRTLMHLEAEKRGDGPITAAVDYRRSLILLRDGSRSLVRSIPIVDEDMNMIVGVASRQELAPDPFHEVLANAAHPDGLARFKGKVVMIGYTSADDRWDVSAGRGDARYGVELQASAVSNLLGGISIRPLRPSAQYVVIVIMGAVGALIRQVLRGGRRASLIGAVVVYALVAFLVYKQYRLIFDISYHIVSLLFMYFMVGWVQRGGREKAVAVRA